MLGEEGYPGPGREDSGAGCALGQVKDSLRARSQAFGRPTAPLFGARGRADVILMDEPASALDPISTTASRTSFTCSSATTRSRS
jgi:hypothetical protein